MSAFPDDEVRGAVARYLETDALLGLTSAPLRPPTAARLGGQGSAISSQGSAISSQRSAISGQRSALATPQTPIPASHTRQPEIRPPSETVASVPHVMAIPVEELAARQAALRMLDESQVRSCTKCNLCRTRTKTVFGQGHAAPRVVFVGEAPGAEEDARGLAFVGRAGQLLTDMIAAMGLSRDEVFICNILKCRPPDNRTPAPDEISACWPYLDEQLRILRPEVIIALGKPASQTLLRTTESIGRLRGRWHDYYTSGSPMVGDPTPLMPTFHPAYLLRSPGEKGKAWSDLKSVMHRLGLPLPPPRSP